MSLESFVNSDLKFLKENLEKYHNVIDFLLGFLTEKQWIQALTESLLDESFLDYSIMEETFIDYVNDWSIDTNVDELILKACYNVRKFDTDLDNKNQIYKTIITNLEEKIAKKD